MLTFCIILFLLFAVAHSCPFETPYPIKKYTWCCSESLSLSATNVSTFCNGGFLHPRAPLQCCNGTIKVCSSPPCKRHKSALTAPGNFNFPHLRLILICCLCRLHNHNTNPCYSSHSYCR